MGEFADKVYDAVCKVPRGKVATYGQIARMVGRPRSARYVGFALRTNPRPGVDADSIPCHRIVFKDGGLCKGFAFGGPDVQLQRLRDEGVSFIEAPSDEVDDGVRIQADLGDGRGMRTVLLADIRVDMGSCQWDGRAETPLDERGAYPTQPPANFDWAAELGE